MLKYKLERYDYDLYRKISVNQQLSALGIECNDNLTRDEITLLKRKKQIKWTTFLHHKLVRHEVTKAISQQQQNLLNHFTYERQLYFLNCVRPIFLEDVCWLDALCGDLSLALV